MLASAVYEVLDYLLLYIILLVSNYLGILYTLFIFILSIVTSTWTWTKQSWTKQFWTKQSWTEIEGSERNEKK